MQLIEMPADMLASLSAPARRDALVWWDRLSESERAEIAAVSIPDVEPSGGPRIIGGRFVPSDDAAGWSEWLAAYVEDLLSRPDPGIHEPPFIPQFHIG